MENELDLDALLTTEDRIRLIIDKLPTLTADHVNLDDSCAICLTGFAHILSDEADLRALADQSDKKLIFEAGVTKLVGCGHMFCRKDLLEWIRSLFDMSPVHKHGSCPACRHVFFDIRPPSDSDEESSDGDYSPYGETEEEEEEDEDEDEEEEEEFLDDDAEGLDEDDDLMNLDLGSPYENWDDTDEETDGEGEWSDADTTFSDGSLNLGIELAALIDDDGDAEAEAADETLCDDAESEK